ncbi:uncharacterized protein LOC144206019 isoform X2 [Stigmatopora nigra]
MTSFLNLPKFGLYTKSANVQENMLPWTLLWRFFDKPKRINSPKSDRRQSVKARGSGSSHGRFCKFGRATWKGKDGAMVHLKGQQLNANKGLQCLLCLCLLLQPTKFHTFWDMGANQSTQRKPTPSQKNLQTPHSTIKY